MSPVNGRHVLEPSPDLLPSEADLRRMLAAAVTRRNAADLVFSAADTTLAVATIERERARAVVACIENWISWIHVETDEEEKSNHH